MVNEHKSNYYSYDLKIKIIDLHMKSSFPVDKLAKMFGISKSSIYSWLNSYKNANLSKHKKEYIKFNSKLRNIKLRNFIFSYIINNCNFLYQTLIFEIKNNLKITLQKSLLYNIINCLNLVKKIAKTKKVYGSSDKNLHKLQTLKNYIKNIKNEDIISIDEVSFDTNIMHRYAWCKKGNSIVKKIGATYKRLTVICAINNKKILHYKIIDGSANSELFLDFIKTIPNIGKKTLFMDNASIHHSKIVKKYTTDNKINILFNVAYCPEYNSIEFVFSMHKKIVKDLYPNNSIKILKDNIIRAFKFITKDNLKNFYLHSFNQLR